MAGLYYLSVTEDFTIGYGDLLQVVGALFWAVHLLVLDHYRAGSLPFASPAFSSWCAACSVWARRWLSRPPV